MNTNIYGNYSEAEMLEDEIQMLQEEENLNRLKFNTRLTRQFC